MHCRRSISFRSRNPQFLKNRGAGESSETVIGAEGYPERVADAFVEVVGNLGGGDEVLIPGKFQTESAGADKLAGHIADIFLCVFRFVTCCYSQCLDFRQCAHLTDTVRLDNHSAVEERIGGYVEVLFQKSEIHKLDTEFEVAPEVAVADQTVGMRASDRV